MLEAIEAAFAPARFLDLHADADHNRSVFTLAAPQGELAQGLLNGARGGGRAGRPARARGAAPARGRARRDAGRLPERGAARRRLRRGAHGRRADRRGARGAGDPLRRAGHAAREPRAGGAPGGRRRGDRRADRERRAGAGLRPGAAAPERGRDAGGRPPAAGRLQPRPRQRRPRAGAARSPPRSARRAAACRACARSGSTWRSAGARRCRPTCTTTASRRCATWWRRCARGPRWPRPSSWAWRRRRPSSGFPEDVPIRGFSPERHLLENALRSLQ